MQDFFLHAPFLHAKFFITKYFHFFPHCTFWLEVFYLLRYILLLKFCMSEIYPQNSNCKHLKHVVKLSVTIFKHLRMNKFWHWDFNRFYHVHSFLSVPDVCLKDTMSLADSLYNLQLIKEFCGSSLQDCCPLAVEDLLYAPPLLHVSDVIMTCSGWPGVKVVDWTGRKHTNSCASRQTLDGNFVLCFPLA